MSTTIAPPVSVSTVSAVPRSKQLDVSVSADLARIRGEYVEMPGLLLNVASGGAPLGLAADAQPSCSPYL
jgi:hypothetical protein